MPFADFFVLQRFEVLKTFQNKLQINSYMLKVYFYIAQKRKPIFINFLFVVPPGIEPGTQGFSVLCSTN